MTMRRRQVHRVQAAPAGQTDQTGRPKPTINMVVVRHAKSPRYGFTLLEMVLAATIGAFLMAAVYVAVDLQIRSAQSGRELIEQSLRARAILTRIGNEIKLCVAATP